MRRGPLRVGDILNSEQLLGREPASFWRENVIADAFHYEFLPACRSGENKLSSVRSFITLSSGEGLTFFNNDNSANVFDGKKVHQNFLGSRFLRIRF